jgi:hypothetical protein
LLVLVYVVGTCTITVRLMPSILSERIAVLGEPTPHPDDGDFEPDAEAAVATPRLESGITIKDSTAKAVTTRRRRGCVGITTSLNTVDFTFAPFENRQ